MTRFTLACIGFTLGFDLTFMWLAGGADQALHNLIQIAVLAIQ